MQQFFTKNMQLFKNRCYKVSKKSPNIAYLEEELYLTLHRKHDNHHDSSLSLMGLRQFFFPFVKFK